MQNNSLEHFRNQEELIRRVDDWLEQREKWNRTIESDFLTPFEQSTIARYLGNRYGYRFVPACEDSIQKVLFMSDEEESSVVCLHASFPAKFIQLTHRDVLGALMNVGLERNQFGDLWIDGNEIFVYTNRQSSEYVMNNVTQIHKAKIRFEIMDGYPNPKFEYKTLQITVSSHRLDQYVSEIAHVSRSKAQKMIQMGFVHLNYNELVQNDDLCHNNDILSIRQVGRFKIGECKAVTKRDNYLMIVYQFV